VHLVCGFMLRACCPHPRLRHFLRSPVGNPLVVQFIDRDLLGLLCGPFQPSKKTDGVLCEEETEAGGAADGAAPMEVEG
jgi:hypothetical protein